MNPHEGGPDYARGYLRVPLPIWRELYCRAPLTRRQLQLVSVVLRESWGWRSRSGEVYRWTRPLSPSQWSQATGLSTDHLTRDLRDLIRRGILREDAGRYQLVADPEMWKTPGEAAPKRRRRAPKPPAESAESALFSPDIKKVYKKQKDVGARTESELSPRGDNSATPSLSVREPADLGMPLSLSPKERTERFLAVLQACLEPLPEELVPLLRDWIKTAGVAEVWRDLAPYLSRGPGPARTALQAMLRARARLRPAGEG
jgi:hypothetical protein